MDDLEKTILNKINSTRTDSDKFKNLFKPNEKLGYKTAAMYIAMYNKSKQLNLTQQEINHVILNSEQNIYEHQYVYPLQYFFMNNKSQGLNITHENFAQIIDKINFKTFVTESLARALLHGFYNHNKEGYDLNNTCFDQLFLGVDKSVIQELKNQIHSTGSYYSITNQIELFNSLLERREILIGLNQAAKKNPTPVTHKKIIKL